jgi:hypothetical protein
MFLLELIIYKLTLVETDSVSAEDNNRQDQQEEYRVSAQLGIRIDQIPHTAFLFLYQAD